MISSFKLTWTSLIDCPTGKKNLKDIIPDFREKCTEDLMRLKVNGLFTSAGQNYFERIQETNIFVYLHWEYLEGASVSFKSVAHCCKSNVLEEIECIGSCRHDEEADYDLLPFMLANPVLEKLYQNVASHTGSAMQLYERVKYVGQNKKYYSITIHKSQGLTLKNVMVDIGTSVFYVVKLMLHYQGLPAWQDST